MGDVTTQVRSQAVPRELCFPTMAVLGIDNRTRVCVNGPGLEVVSGGHAQGTHVLTLSCPGRELRR